MPRKKIDLTGMRFGYWTVLETTGRSHTGLSLWKCRCDCGRERDGILYNSLTTGGSTSCGCSRVRFTGKHELSRRRLRSIYQGMLTRCLNANHPTFPRYGGAGITVCRRWLNDFDAFISDMGYPPSVDHSLDRSPNNKGNYEPGNVRWATRDQQACNTSANVWYDWKGKRLLLPHIAELEGVAYCSLRNRMFLYDYPLERAVDYCKERGLKWKSRRKRDEFTVPAGAPQVPLTGRELDHLLAN